MLKSPLLDTAEMGTYDSEVRFFTTVNLPEMLFKIYLIDSYGIRLVRFGKVFLLDK